MRKGFKSIIFFLSTISLNFASVTLECPGELTNGQEVKWLRNGVEITEEIGKVNPRQSIFENRYFNINQNRNIPKIALASLFLHQPRAKSELTNLRVKPKLTSDQAFNILTLELDFDTQDYNIANCVLNSTDDEESLNYSIESSSFLQLESRGYPDSTLVYFDANGTELVESESDSGVNITASGTYECSGLSFFSFYLFKTCNGRYSAFNAVGMDSKAIKITSSGPNLEKENVHVMKPTSKLILEAASIFDQPLQVNWRQNLDYLPRTVHSEEIELMANGRVKTTSKLQISSEDSLTLNESGLYEAEFIIGINGSHYISNKQFDVKVEIPPKNENIKIEASPAVGQIAKGESVKVTCRYEFDGDHLIQPSTILNDGEDSLTIESLDSIVEVKCQARNTAGSSSAKMVLIPNTPPEITSLDFDDDKNIICNATGYPEPTVTIQLPSGASKNENMIPKFETSSGIYRCTASNLLGQASVIRQIDPFDAAAIALVISATAAFVLLIVLLSHKLHPLKLPSTRCGTMDIPQEHRPSESYRQRRSAEPKNHQIPQKFILSSSSSSEATVADNDSPQVVIFQPPSF
ncbi:unnamed protein product [Oikopleura dioica]|uniref:Ig-like domain-containing protein n=1 Tax=Oikopleura dioica TaxID=34765 RepID=E4YMT1_OIKDI|nr:unnamed protein product [Oikopleura dioica]